MPDSAVYTFLSKGNIPEFHPELVGIENSVIPDPRQLNHSMHLASAMSSFGLQEPEFTNYTLNFQGTLDYIWYTPSFFNIDTILLLPQEVEILKLGQALPNAVLPSDHLLLSCDFSLNTG